MASMQSYLPVANPRHAAINLIVLGTICVSNTVATSSGRRMRQFTQCSDLFSRWNVTPNFFAPAGRILVYSKDTKVNETFDDQRQFLLQQSRKHFVTNVAMLRANRFTRFYLTRITDSSASSFLVLALSALYREKYPK
ncbi:hypothetical protein DER46DRAFT_59834 [Fusarium sp. MPI-SDFR-AT-0072]|nr:hypothetical protein DER46DRAFT_59834 [Fusarium sp. MPI-SDFR-AT-0072]